MQFKHPELLYALFVLLIPIVVHLFQFRKFRKEAFTNVKFLKRVELQTRKSSQLKKWLTLLARLLALAALVFAFAQPFIPHSQQALKEKETIVYLDNSFSMQQQGTRGDLLKQAVQQLLQVFPADQTIRVMTNNRTFPKSTLDELKNDLLNLSYASDNNSLQTMALKAGSYFSDQGQTTKRLIAISDFQKRNIDDSLTFDGIDDVHFIQMRGKNHVNYSVDSVFIPSDDLKKSTLKVKVSASRAVNNSLPISLYDNDKLLAKSSIGFSDDSTAITTFSLPENRPELQGHIKIDDRSLRFDNTFYFSLQKPEKIKVVSVNADEKKGTFLKKIFKEDDFDYTALPGNKLDYNSLENANFIVLNQLKTLPDGLDNMLNNRLKNGGYVTLIPDVQSDLNDYNKLLTHLNLGQLSPYKKRDLQLTTINFSHPLYHDVFDRHITNFDYPSFDGSFDYTGRHDRVLSFNNGQGFLIGRQNTYLFTAPLDAEHTNFKRSPLIAPTFYNMAKQSMKAPRLFYSIGQHNEISIATRLKKDEVLHLKKGSGDFIPQQRRYEKQVSITTAENPKKAGTYQIDKGQKTIGHLSYNYDRRENDLRFAAMDKLYKDRTSHNIDKFFTAQINESQLDELWKWFIIFAVVFLLIEVAFLKFLK